MFGVFFTEPFNDHLEVSVDLAQEMDICAIYIHHIAVLAICRHWDDIRG